MTNVAVAAISQEAARAGTRVAREGGSAVDAALSASLLAVISHPGMCSLGGACFITVWPPDGADPVVVDGGHEMPGRGLPEARFGRGGEEVELDFAGGMRTTVGPGSVATPGLLAAFDAASERFGAVPWKELFGPALELARSGFPLPAACRVFLKHAHEAIYGVDPRSRGALHDAEGRLIEAGETVRVEGLAQTLEVLAESGAQSFYRGEVARRIADHVQAEGGLLTRRDLASYEAEWRRPLRAAVDDWSVATNPPPAMGGGVLAAALRLLPGTPRNRNGWSAGDVRRLVDALEAVARFREREVLGGDDVDGAIRRLLDRAEAAAGDPARMRESASTIHTSVVDENGLACSVTCSDGYGSGVMPPGTGLWLNNALGERDLTRGEFHALEPGERLSSNMAPTAVRHPDGRVLAIGSPGADRIPGIILQALLGHLRGGLSLEDAVEHPRLHVEVESGEARVVAEPGLPLEQVDLPVSREPDRSLAFGGVTAAALSDGRLDAASDSRRDGGAVLS